MNGVGTYGEFVESRGVVLDSLGLRDRALVRGDALQAIDLLEAAGIPVLGGDVYIAKQGKIESAYANWYTDQREGETISRFAARSFAESRSYISKFPDPTDGMALFALVIGAGNDV